MVVSRTNKSWCRSRKKAAQLSKGAGPETFRNEHPDALLASKRKMMEALGYVAIMCIGLVLGSIGAGGSMLAIPVLVYLFSLDMETASAYSLFLVGMTSLTGAALKQRRQLVSARAALLFGLPSVAGAFASRNWMIVLIPDVVWQSDAFMLTKDDLLLRFFSLLVLASSLSMLLKKQSHGEAGRNRNLMRLIPVGLTTGIVAGLAGAGGGFLILPSLILFAALPFSMAAGTGLVIIASNSLLGFCGDLINRSIDWSFLVTLTTLSILGLLIGYWSQDKIASLPAQRVLAWFMLVIGIAVLVGPR